MQRAPSRCRNILVVEDEHEIRQALVELLECEGYHVFAAGNGRDGLEMLKKMTGPCLVLLDFMMPVMDGQEFLAVKTHDHAIASIPVVVVSAYDDRAKALPSAGFVRKPIDLDSLLAFVNRFCGPGARSDLSKSEP